MNQSIVVGAAGALGINLTEALTAVGEPVIAVARRRSPYWPAGTVHVNGDITQPAGLINRLPGNSVIYHCANAPYHRWPQQLPPLMEGVIELAKRIGSRVVYADNLYGYGRHDGPIHEGLPSKPDTIKGTVRATIARRLMSEHRAGTLKATIVRASDFFGPHVCNSVLGDYTFRQIGKGGTVNMIGRVDVPHSYTYIKDFARALAELGRDERGAGEVWHAPAASSLNASEFVERAARVAGSPAKAAPMPGWLFSVMGLFIPAMREYREMLYEFNEPFVIDSSKFERAFRTKATDLDVALKETLDSLQRS